MMSEKPVDADNDNRWHFEELLFLKKTSYYGIRRWSKCNEECSRLLEDPLLREYSHMLAERFP